MTSPRISFMLPGFPNCGTSSLCDLMKQNADVFIPTPKEPSFFSIGRFERELSWGWYNSLYEGAENSRAVGDCTVNYCCSRARSLASPATIAEFFPDLRLIFVVRDPIRRIETHWRHHAVIGHPRGLHAFNSAVERFSMLVNTSRYYSHINRFRAHYSDDQILVLFFEDFVRDPVSTTNKALKFVGVDAQTSFERPNDPRNRNDSKYRDGALASWIRTVPGYRSLRRLTPSAISGIIRPALKVRNSEQMSWSPDVLEWVVAELEDDWARLLKFANKEDADWMLNANAYL